MTPKLTEKNLECLKAVVEATQTVGMIEARPKDPHIKKLLGMELIIQNPENETQFQATQAGKDIVNGVNPNRSPTFEPSIEPLVEEPAETEPSTEPETEQPKPQPEGAKQVSGIEIESGVPIPKSRRGRKGSKYPFEQMEVGDSFHEPATEENPNPIKKLASTASSATTRSKDEDGNATKKFVARVAADDDPKGPGARIFRVM